MPDIPSAALKNGRLHGTSRAYILDRLRRENQRNWIAAIESGGVSAFAVAVELGWARRPPTKRGAAANQAKRRRHSLVEEQRRISGSRPDDLTLLQEQELWLGISHHGSVFRSRAEAEMAWQTHREHLMQNWAHDGKRPAGWWAFEAPFPRPPFGHEASRLYAAGLLAAEEAAKLEADWKEQFIRAQQPGFFYCAGPGQLYHREEARQRHYVWADIPVALVEAWTGVEQSS
jgi:hypothetical protein